MIEIEIPNNIKVKELDLKVLDEDWNNHPPNSITQKIGDNFIDSIDECLLKVPSAVVQGDFNYLINPYHSDFKKIKIIEITDFPFDKRIFK
jgi:RES domain-containing protein